MQKNKTANTTEALNVDNLISKYNLTLNEKTKRYDCKGDVHAEEDLVENGKLKIKFGSVGGDFDCSELGLTSLVGSPRKVNGDFDCSCNHLDDLYGSPLKIGGSFNCSDSELRTLDGAPIEVGENFDCSNNNLYSLEYAPKYVDGAFVCKNNALCTLRWHPKSVGIFDCSANAELPIRRSKPNWVEYKYYRDNQYFA